MDFHGYGLNSLCIAAKKGGGGHFLPSIEEGTLLDVQGFNLGLQKVHLRFFQAFSAKIYSPEKL